MRLPDFAVFHARVAPLPERVTVRSTRPCAGCQALVTVPGVLAATIGRPLWCAVCSPVGPFGPPEIKGRKRWQ